MPPVAIPPRLLDTMARLRATYGAAQAPVPPAVAHVPAPMPVAVTGDTSRDPRRRDPRLQPKAEAAEVRCSMSSKRCRIAFSQTTRVRLDYGLTATGEAGPLSCALRRAARRGTRGCGRLGQPAARVPF